MGPGNQRHLCISGEASGVHVHVHAEHACVLFCPDLIQDTGAAFKFCGLYRFGFQMRTGVSLNSLA